MNPLSRARTCLYAFWAGLVLLGPWTVAAQEARFTQPFDRVRLVELARSRAGQPANPPTLDPESPLGSLDYDQYRAIRFRRDASIWSREERGFWVGLLPPGFIYRTPVKINLVVGGLARRVLYATDLFEYGLDTAPMRGVQASGYSGFRVSTQINRREVFDEFLVFQGASYFRAVGRGDLYGLSARGLAVRTARPEGEEYPIFSEFWIERPKVGATRIVVHALLESDSITGAYTFTAAPGRPTAVEVEATLFPRRDLSHFGVAPLTSMFLFGGIHDGRFDDFRPAVHDSDGLAIELANGERVWRPLANPTKLQVSAFAADRVTGFGLMQRHRRFEDYQDAEARYDLRPSAWIEPAGDWGKGHVELVEIPTDAEIHDNIVAYWHPAQPLVAGQAYTLSYRMLWGDGSFLAEKEAHVVATRSGAARQAGVREFVVDLAAPSIPRDLAVNVTTSAGKVREARGFVVEANGVYRVVFELDPQGAALAELRLVVSSDGQPWGETWLYRWTR